MVLINYKVYDGMRTLVHFQGHSHFDLVSLLLALFTNERVAQLKTQMIECSISLYLKMGRSRVCSSLLSNTSYQNILIC